jgi:hypothetical protein
MATIGTLLIELSANVARLENDLGKAASHVRNTERLIQQSVNRMNGFFGLLGVGISGAAMVGFVKSGIDAQDMLATLSERTGTSVRDLAGLKYAAEQNSTSLEAVANAGKKLASGMADNPALFRSMGITAKTSTDAMIQMADLFANMPDGVQKTALAVKLMGKSGEEMIPFLNQGSDSLRKLIDAGKAMSPVTAESAARAKEFNDQLNTLKTQASGVGMELANVMLPALTSTAAGMSDLAKEGHPVLALWRGLAGMGQIPWDFLMPPDNAKESLKSANRIKELQVELADVERSLKTSEGGGLINKWLHGTREEQQQRAAVLRNQIETLKRHGAELDAPPKPPKTKPAATPLDLSNSTDGLQVLKALELDYQNTLAKRAEAMNYPLMSISERALAEDLRTVHDSAAKSRVELEKLNVSGKLSATDYAQRLKELKTDEEAQVEAITRMRTAQDELNRSWQFGAKSALRTYLDEVNNVAKQSEAMFGRAFKGMEDALVQFVQTGKMDFASLRDSIIADLIRIQIQQTVTGPLAGLVGSMFGGAGGTAASTIGSTVSVGSSPSLLDGIINTSLSGARASGGPVNSNSLYQVNEKGPELLNYGGTDYLMMGGKGGYVKPVDPVSPFVGTPQNNSAALMDRSANDGSYAVAASLLGISSALVIGLSGIGDAIAAQPPVINNVSHFLSQLDQSSVNNIVNAYPGASGTVDRGPTVAAPTATAPTASKTISIVYSPTIQIDSRTDQAEVHRLVSNAVKQGNAELVDKLQRQGAI